MTTNRYDCLTTDHRVFTMDGTSPEHAARRVADLYWVTVIATRPTTKPAIRVGMGTGFSEG